MTYWSERMQSKISSGKRHMGHRPEETRHRLLKVFSQDTLKSSSNEPWQKTWNVCQGSSVDTQYLEFLSGTGHIGTLCLAYKIPDSRRNVYMQHKPHCLHKQVRLGEPFLTGNLSSQMPAKGHPLADLSMASSLRPVLVSLFCTTHILCICWTSFIFFIYFIFSCYIEDTNHNSFWSSCLSLPISGFLVGLFLLFLS